jgi:steroid delta-isomerase-like uncharacterized protein
MSTEENKALCHRYVEEWNKQNMAGVEELCAPDLVIHGAPPAPSISGDLDLQGLRQLRTGLWTAFPDAHLVLEGLIAEGDKVAYRVTVRGTHQGEFMGIPPTGKQISLTGMEIDRIEAGKFVEGWANADNLGLLQQLGAIPQMAQGGA